MADQRTATKIAREAERLSKAFARQLGTVLRSAQQRMQSEIRAVEGGGALGAGVSGGPPLVGVPRLRIRRVLDEVGADALMAEAVTTGLPLMARLTMQSREAGVLATLEAIQAQLYALSLGHYDDLIVELDRLAQAVSQTLLRAGLTARTRTTIAQDITDLLDEADSRITTLHDTLVSIYGREVEAVSAGNDPETLFAYMGPVDEKTREFCLDIVGKVFTRAEIDEMDNGQIDNVFLTGGGYNCRHIFMEISRFSELADLAGTGKRAPDVDVDVQALREEQVA